MPRAKKNLSAVLDVIEEQVINDVPEELRQQLNALSEITEDETVSMEQVEQSWESAAQEIARIDERAEIAIQVVTTSIRTQAAVAKGRVILQVREKFGHLPVFNGSFTEFSKRIGTNAPAVMRWVNAALAVEEHSPTFGDDYMMNLAPRVLHELHTLPDAVQSAMLEDATGDGRNITTTEVMEVKESTPVKLLSATEKLEEKQEIVDAAHELMTEAAASGTDKQSPEYQQLYSQAQNAVKSIETLNEKIATLKSDLVGEKAKAESAQKAQESLNKELENLKWDDETTREQRVKRIQSTLTVGIPNVLADLMRFVTEENHYSDAYKKSIREQMVTLKTFLEEHNV